MTLEEAREHYYSHSGQASSAARQLAFAGIAAVWILSTDNDLIPVEFSGLLLPLLLFVSGIFFDLVQYYYLASFWGIFARQKEKSGLTEFSGAPDWSNRIGIGCWVAKGVVVVAGYVVLGLELVSAILGGPTPPVSP